MKGTCAADGKSLSGIDHLRQSIRDILTTPLGSRVARRWYGSELYLYVDAPVNRLTLADIYRVTAVALAAVNPLTGSPVEPRFRLKSVLASSAAPGSLVLDLTGDYLPEGKAITLDGIEVY